MVLRVTIIVLLLHIHCKNIVALSNKLPIDKTNNESQDANGVLYSGTADSGIPEKRTTSKQRTSCNPPNFLCDSHLLKDLSPT